MSIKRKKLAKVSISRKKYGIFVWAGEHWLFLYGENSESLVSNPSYQRMISISYVWLLFNVIKQNMGKVFMEVLHH